MYNIIHIQYFRRYVTLGRTPLPCHKVSHSADPPPPRERYVIVERSHITIY